MHRFIAAALAASSCASIAQAQTSPPALAGGSLSLEEALRQAGAASPSTDVAAAGVRAADANRAVAGLRPNPEISVETENVTGTGPYRGFNQAETTVGFALPIELGGKRSARIAVADARGTRARLETAIALADLRLRVTQAYIEAVTAERRLEVAGEQARIADEGLRVAADRVMVGASSPIDEQRAAVLQINARTALERARREVETTREILAELLGQPVSGPLDTAWFERTAAYGPVAAIDLDGTLALAAATADVTTADAQVRLARSQRIPDVTLSAGTRRYSATGDQAAVFGVSIPLPFFNNGSAAVSVARAERDQADARRRLATLDAGQAIARAQADVANAEAAARSANGPALAAALEAARIARTGYGAGKFSQLELLDAERTLAETRAAAIEALAAYHDAQARLRRLTSPAPVDLQNSGDHR